MAGGIKFDISEVLKRAMATSDKIDKACELYAQTAGEKLVEDAKNNAKWTDDTGNSRQTIDYDVKRDTNKIALDLQGHTPQFKYLELAQEKKYAILQPTVDKFKDEVIKGWAETIKGL